MILELVRAFTLTPWYWHRLTENFIVIKYDPFTTLFKVKQHSQQKLNIQYKACWILHKMVIAHSFFTFLLVHTTTPTIPTNNPFYFEQPIFTSLLHLPNKAVSTIRSNTPFLYTHLFYYFFIQPSLQFPFSQSKLRLGPTERKNLVRTDAVLTSPEAWRGITTFTITDSYRLDSENWCITGNRMANHSLHLLQYRQPIIITSIP